MGLCQYFPIAYLYGFGDSVESQDGVAATRSLNFVIAAMFPVCRVFRHAGPNHVQVDIDEATPKVLA